MMALMNALMALMNVLMNALMMMMILRSRCYTETQDSTE
jgi:hypothetical protein